MMIKRSLCGSGHILYAHVSPNGVIDVENSKGISQANITHPHTGLYCFSGLPVVKGGQITPDLNVLNAHETGQFWSRR
jgi:hypothetical protein